MTEPDWLPLRFRDLDAYGHVYHAEYLTLLDEARSRWFTAIGLGESQDYVLVHLEIDWSSPLTAEDRVVAASFQVEAIGTTSITLIETLRAGNGREVSRGRTVNVLWDASAGESQSLSPQQRAALEGQPQ